MYELKALEREADEAPWEFSFDSETYRLPSQPDIRVITAFTTGDLERAFTLLLGAEQWQRLQGSPKLLGIKALQDLLTAYFTDAGMDAEKSTASTPSSNGTATP